MYESNLAVCEMKTYRCGALSSCGAVDMAHVHGMDYYFGAVLSGSLIGLLCVLCLCTTAIGSEQHRYYPKDFRVGNKVETTAPGADDFSSVPMCLGYDVEEKVFYVYQRKSVYKRLNEAQLKKLKEKARGGRVIEGGFLPATSFLLGFDETGKRVAKIPVTEKFFSQGEICIDRENIYIYSVAKSSLRDLEVVSKRTKRSVFSGRREKLSESKFRSNCWACRSIKRCWGDLFDLSIHCRVVTPGKAFVEEGSKSLILVLAGRRSIGLSKDAIEIEIPFQAMDVQNCRLLGRDSAGDIYVLLVMNSGRRAYRPFRIVKISEEGNILTNFGLRDKMTDWSGSTHDIVLTPEGHIWQLWCENGEGVFLRRWAFKR